MIYPLTVQAERLADKPAVVEDRPDGTVITWTYAEMNRQANRLANVFRDLGLKPGERFIWCGPNSLGVVNASHARQKIGATTVPLNYRLTPEETAYIVEDSDAVLVYVDAEFAETFARIRPKIPRVRDIVTFGGPTTPGMLDGDALVANASDAEPPIAPADHPASMLYTSGTTGRPKGAVRLPLDPAAVVPLLKHIGFVEEDVYITTGPLYHSGPGGFMQIAQLFGNICIVQRRFDARRLAPACREVSREHDVFGADPDPSRRESPGAREGEVRPLEHEADDRERGAVVVRPQGAVPGGLSRRLAVGGLRLDGARRRHRARAAGSATQAGLVRSPRAGRRAEAVRRHGERGHRARCARRSLRAQRQQLRRLSQGGGEVRGRTGAKTI